MTEKTNQKTIATMFLLILSTLVPAGYCAATSQDLNDPDRGDSAFIEDLNRVRAVAKQKAQYTGIKPQGVDSYVSEQLERYKRFSKFAKEKMAPHSRAIVEGRKTPEKLLAAGEAKLAADKDSWEGHDYIATARLFQKDIKGAADSYTKALNSAPPEVRGWYQYMLGITSQMGSDQEQALAWMNKAIEDNNNWAAVKGAHLNKAAIYVSRNAFDKAAASLESYFAMAREVEAELIAKGPICKMTISSGFKAGGCEIK